MFFFVSLLSMLSSFIKIVGGAGVIGLLAYGAYISLMFDTTRGLTLVGASILAGILVAVSSMTLRAFARAGGSED
jgi:hypothetical protein